MTIACPDCGDTSAPASHCPGCGSVALAEIVAGVRRRHPAWNDADAFEQWILRNANLVCAGMVCRDCGSIMSGGKQPSGRPSTCVVCACGYGPSAPAKKKRATRARKSTVTANLELLA
jgi:hypothetical protein